MGRDRAPALACILALLSVLAPGAGGAKKLVPDGAVVPVAVEISGKLYQYYPVTAKQPLFITVEGPASFDAIARWQFEGSDRPVDVEVELSLDGEPRARHVFRAVPGKASYPERPWALAGRAEHLALDDGVPAGPHVIRIALVRPAIGVLGVNPLSTPVARGKLRLLGRTEFGASYDSNIFRYSDADVDDFLDGLRPDRFPIESVDDLRIEPGFSLSLVREEPGVRSTALAVGADFRLATVNGEKSFGRLSASLRERRNGRAYLSLEYVAIPNYHVRHIWDADAPAGGSPYRSCDFGKQGFGVEVGSDRSLPIDLAARWKYEAYRYDPDFVEYDARVSTAGLRAILRPRAGLRLDLGYALRQSVAKGYDEAGETRDTSDESDTSYDEDEYELRARWEAGRLWGRDTVLWLRGRLARRFYLTEKSRIEDPYHAGRDDTYVTVGAGIEARLSSAATVEVFLERRTREANSDAVPDIGSTKDFGANRIGLKLVLEGVHFLD
jgi:hypothetical protein